MSLSFSSVTSENTVSSHILLPSPKFSPSRTLCIYSYYPSGGWNGVLAGISQVKNPATMWRHLVLDIGVSATPHPKKASGVSEDAWFIASDSFDGRPG